jgi:hypothetical protein
MAKTIKEIYTDLGGNTTIEYFDDTTSKYNIANTLISTDTSVTVGGVVPTDGQKSSFKDSFAVVGYRVDSVTSLPIISTSLREVYVAAVYQSAVPIVSPLDTVNNVLLSVKIPGNSMGKNGRLQIRMMWSYLNNANAKTIKVRFGGIAFAYNAGLSSQAGANIIVDIINRGMTGSQIMTPINVGGTISGLTQPFGTSNVDTTIDQLLTFECTKSVGTDTAILEAVFVEISK